MKTKILTMIALVSVYMPANAATESQVECVKQVLRSLGVT
jgi:hypothetical protein